jgi:hypothetical protein
MRCSFVKAFAVVAKEVGRISCEIACGPADLIDGGRRDLFGLRQVLRPVVRTGLGISDGLGQRLTQLSLRLRRLPHDRYLPVSHERYVGMPERELKPIGDRKNQRLPTARWAPGGYSSREFASLVRGQHAPRTARQKFRFGTFRRTGALDCNTYLNFFACASRQNSDPAPRVASDLHH